MSFSSVLNGLSKLTLNVTKCGTSLVESSRPLTNYAYVPKPPGKGGPMKQYKRLVKYPEKYTVQKLPIIKLGGRDPYTGRVVVGTVGGGRPQKARWVDHVRNANEDGSPRVERVFAITYNPLSPARIAVVAGGDRIRYIVAHTEMKVGDLITTYSDIPKNPVKPKVGDAHPVGALPMGTTIHSIEMYPGQGGHWCINAGTCATILRRINDQVVVQLPSKKEACISKWCMAVVGQVSNPEHKDQHIGSANRLRRLGYRSRSGLWHRKDGYCGRKIRPLAPMKTFTSSKEETSETVI